ncbi:MAG: hypothetical protein R3C61_07885 [Bacteroidia bacterium]
MVTSNSFQDLLFEKIKEKIPSHESFPNIVADILGIGIDGAYRRIRGETPLKIDEIVSLSETFSISLDELSQSSKGSNVVFHQSGMIESGLDPEVYLRNLLGVVSDIHRRKPQIAYYSVKDIPVFHLFQIPEIALFKMFFWRKTIFSDHTLDNSLFSLEVQSEVEKRCISLCRLIAEKYSLIPSIEIWNTETVASFIKQIGYYLEAGMFQSKEDAIILCNKVEEYFHHLKREAELGYKYIIDHPPASRVENFQLYYNDLVMNDNHIAVRYENRWEGYVIFTNTEYLHTTHQGFAQKLGTGLENQTRKSELISKVGERVRNKFFNQIFERLGELHQSIR